MSKYILIVFTLVASAFFLYQGSVAGAAELLVGKGKTEKKVDESRPGSKQLGGGKTIYNKNSNSVSPLYGTTKLKRSSTTFNENEIPVSWKNMDKASRAIKEGQRFHALKEAKEISKDIDKNNVEGAKAAQADAMKEKAKESSTAPKKAEKPKAGTAGSKKRGTVIKRVTDPNGGKPKKVFNTPY